MESERSWALHEVADWNGSVEIAQMLSTPELDQISLDPALGTAVAWGREQLTHFLLSHGATIRYTIHHLIRRKRASGVRLLLKIRS
jgi:hypothetical protein